VRRPVRDSPRYVPGTVHNSQSKTAEAWFMCTTVRKSASIIATSAAAARRASGVRDGLLIELSSHI